MTFIQIVEIRTDKMDEMRKLDEEWERETAGKRTARRSIITTDRNDPNRHLVMVFFDSYEDAMKNSNMPETQAFAEREAKIADSISFHDLDVVADHV